MRMLAPAPQTVIVVAPRRRRRSRARTAATLALAGGAAIAGRRYVRGALATGLKTARAEVAATRRQWWRPLKARAATHFQHILNQRALGARKGARRGRRLLGQLLGPARRLRRTLRGRW